MHRLKRPLALALALVLVFALGACGESFESDIARAASKMQDLKSVHADMVLDMAFDIDGVGSLDMALDTSMDTAGDLTSGEISMTLLGIPISVLYVVQVNDDSCDLYMSMDGGTTWQAETGLTLEELESSQGISSDAGSMVDFYLEVAKNFGEAVEETVDGVECRRYDGVFPGESLTEAMSMSGGSAYADVPEGVTLGDAPISLWIAKDSGLPVRISLDMADAMGQYMTGALAESGLSEDAMSVSALTVTIDLSEFDTAEPMPVPQV